MNFFKVGINFDFSLIPLFKELNEKYEGKGKIIEVNTGAMARGYRSQAYPEVHLLEYIASKNGKIILNLAIKKAEDYLTQKYKRGPTDIELSSFLEIPVYKLVETRNCYQTLSLDDDTNESSLYDFVSSDDVSKDDLILLRDALNRLETKEKELIIKRYFYNKTQQEVANELGINQVKVSREEGKVLTKLKKYM